MLEYQFLFRTYSIAIFGVMLIFLMFKLARRNNVLGDTERPLVAIVLGHLCFWTALLILILYIPTLLKVEYSIDLSVTPSWDITDSSLFSNAPTREQHILLTLEITFFLLVSLSTYFSFFKTCILSKWSKTFKAICFIAIYLLFGQATNIRNRNCDTFIVSAFAYLVVWSMYIIYIFDSISNSEKINMETYLARKKNNNHLVLKNILDNGIDLYQIKLLIISKLNETKSTINHKLLINIALTAIIIAFPLTDISILYNESKYSQWLFFYAPFSLLLIYYYTKCLYKEHRITLNHILLKPILSKYEIINAREKEKNLSAQLIKVSLFPIFSSLVTPILALPFYNDRTFSSFAHFLLSLPIFLWFYTLIFQYIKNQTSNNNVHERPPLNKNTYIRKWKLLDFAKEYGKLQIGSFINKDTNEEFKSCIFTKENGERTFVAFSSTLGELTPAEIIQKKNELYVIEHKKGVYALI